METEQPSADSAVSSRPQRERHLPGHLDNFEVGYIPGVTVPPTTTAEGFGATAPAPGGTFSHPPASRFSASSRRSSARTQTSSHSTTKRSITDGLSELQSAMLEEQVKRMELAEVQWQIMEQTLIDEQCSLLDKEARDALNEKEELLREQERQRCLLDEKAEMAYKRKRGYYQASDVATAAEREGNGSSASSSYNVLSAGRRN